MTSSATLLSMDLLLSSFRGRVLPDFFGQKVKGLLCLGQLYNFGYVAPTPFPFPDVRVFTCSILRGVSLEIQRSGHSPVTLQSLSGVTLKERPSLWIDRDIGRDSQVQQNSTEAELVCRARFHGLTVGFTVAGDFPGMIPVRYRTHHHWL